MINDYRERDAVGSNESSEFFLCDSPRIFLFRFFVDIRQNTNPPGVFFQTAGWNRTAEGKKRIQTAHAHEIIEVYDEKEQNLASLPRLYF